MSAFTEYFVNNRENSEERAAMIIHSCPELLERIQQVGFLPLLESGVRGYCAESLMDEDCRFTQFDDGSWEWPLWQWKGDAVRVASGGPTCTTGAEAKAQNSTNAALRESSSRPCRRTVA